MTKVTLSNGNAYSLEPPKGKHLRLLSTIVLPEDGQMLAAYKMISVLATPSITVDEIDELDGEDVVRLLEIAKGFRLNGAT